MGGILAPEHLFLVLVVALFVVGPSKLPETGAALGKAFRDFRSAMSGELPTGSPSIDRSAGDDPRPPGSEA